MGGVGDPRPCREVSFLMAREREANIPPQRLRFRISGTVLKCGLT